MTRLNARSRIAFAATAVVIVLALVGCSSQPPAPAAPPSAPTAAPPVKETVVVKETIVVKETVVVQPTTAPTVTPTATSTPTPTRAPVVAPAATKPPAMGAKLEFTVDDIEYAATKRKGDNKIQLTITLHPKGGVAPYNFVLDPDAPDAKTKVETKVKGLTFTFDWHNCSEPATHTIVLYSADGQKVGPVGFLYGYPCE